MKNIFTYIGGLTATLTDLSSREIGSFSGCVIIIHILNLELSSGPFFHLVIISSISSSQCPNSSKLSRIIQSPLNAAFISKFSVCSCCP